MAETNRSKLKCLSVFKLHILNKKEFNFKKRGEEGEGGGVKNELFKNIFWSILISEIESADIN